MNEQPTNAELLQAIVALHAFTESGLVRLDTKIDAKVDGLRFDMVKRLDRMDERFDRMDERFDRMDERFDRLDLRFDRMDQRFDRMDERFGRMDGDLQELKTRFIRFEHGGT